ncbi:MAG: Gfo/Idh/MocA family oxidoreductase [Alphaproteobacteria bacterium]
MSQTLNIAFLGLGDHATRGHLEPLLKLMGEDTIFGVFDPHKTKALRAGKYGKNLRFFRSEKTLLKWADAVLICTPDHLHLGQMEAAIAAGCHVMCEKPLVSNASDMPRLRKVLKKAERDNLVITSCHPRRCDLPYKGVKDDLPFLQERYGKLLEVRLDFSYHAPSKVGLHGGSLLQDHANHEIDYLCYLLGEVPKYVEAYKLFDSFDRYHMCGRVSGEVAFTFTGTRRLPESTYPETIFLRFERGEMFVDTYSEENSYHLEHATRKRYDMAGVGVTDYPLRFHQLNHELLNAFQGGNNYLSAEQLLLNTEMSVAFHTSDRFTYNC